MIDVQICIVGWHFFEDIFNQIKESELDIYVVAHRHNEILDENINSIMIDNVGLEYGAYDYFIKNVWNKKSDVIFMHDDIEIIKFNSFIKKNYKKFKEKELDHAPFSPAKHVSASGTCFCMSSKIINIIKVEYGGIWWDKENFGYTTHKTAPADWHVRRTNQGGGEFHKMITEIGKKHDLLVYSDIIDPSVTLYSRGKDKIKIRLTSREKLRQREATKAQKKRRKKFEAEWKKKKNEK